jgi:threonylcarbamoyladenosine tRNA methylthiotransferase CDKAL1
MCLYFSISIRILTLGPLTCSLDLPKIRKNPYVEIVPISTGCLNQCTYCKTKHARGQLGSYPPEDIVNRIKKVVNEEGVVEIWLSSEDTGAYGRDIGTDLPSLLWKIVEVLPEGMFCLIFSRSKSASVAL